jgi:hypothetical protein
VRKTVTLDEDVYRGCRADGTGIQGAYLQGAFGFGARGLNPRTPPPAWKNRFPAFSIPPRTAPMSARKIAAPMPGVRVRLLLDGNLLLALAWPKSHVSRKSGSVHGWM